MGQQLAVVSGRISTALQSVLESSPAYRHELRALLCKYAADRTISAQQVLQWSGEKLVADATNEQHDVGKRFLPQLAEIDLGNFDAHTVTQCIAQAAMAFLEELKLDMNFHVRYLDCAGKGCVDKLQKIQPFVDLNFQNEAGSTALMIACHENHAAMVAHLLNSHVNANLQDALGWTALMFCARDGHIELVDLLLSDEYDTDIDLTAHNGINALMCAADAGHFKIVQAIMERGADVNARTNAGDTALLHSCHGGHTSIVRLLLTANADVNVSGKHLCSPSLLAARFGSYEILELLIQHGADIAAQDEERRTICNFESEGQVAAAIQRGVVGRFNKMIIKPAFGSPMWGNVPRNNRMTNGHADDSQSLVSSSASSPLPYQQTPHPRGKLPVGSVSTVTDSPPSASSIAAATQASSRSRTPSPTSVPVRARAGQPLRPRPTDLEVTLPRDRSKAFHHPGVGDALTDAALADLEAGVEQLLQRRIPAPTIVAAAPGATNSLIRASRIESPLSGTRRDNHAQAAALFVRSASDNVHQYEAGSDSAREIDDGESDSEQVSDDASEPGFSDASPPMRSAPVAHTRHKSIGSTSNFMATLDAHLLSTARSDDSDPSAPSPVVSNVLPGDEAMQPFSLALTAVSSPRASSDGAAPVLQDDAIDFGHERTHLQEADTTPKIQVSLESPLRDLVDPADLVDSSPVAVPATLDTSSPVDSDAPPQQQPPLSSSLASSVVSTPLLSSSSAPSPLGCSAELTPSVLESPVLTLAEAPSTSRGPSASPLDSATSRPTKRRPRKVVDIAAAPVAPTMRSGLFGAIPSVAAPPSRAQLNPTPVTTSTKPSPASSPPMRAASPPPAAVAAQSRQSQERAVDSWLLSVGFDAVSRSSLAGFTFTDLHSLDMNDCCELIGERAGLTLFGLLRQRGKETTSETAVTGGASPTVNGRRRSWAEAAVDGMIAAAVEEQVKLSSSRATPASSPPSLAVVAPRTEILTPLAAAPPSRSTSGSPPVAMAVPVAPARSIGRSTFAEFLANPLAGLVPSPAAANNKPSLLQTMRAANNMATGASVSEPKPATVALAPSIRGSAASLNAVNDVIASSQRLHGFSIPPLFSSAASPPQSPPASSSVAASALPTATWSTTPPAPTGFYTQDLINSQRAWLAGTLQSVKFSLQGTSTREEMRKNQPHRLRRAAAEAEATAAMVPSADSQPQQAPVLSAWDQLGHSPPPSPPLPPQPQPQAHPPPSTSIRPVVRAHPASGRLVAPPPPSAKAKPPPPPALPSLDYLNSF